MATYGYVIGSEDGVVSQFDHASGAFVRRVCQLNPSWTASVSDFDTVTGLPNPDVLEATDTSVPCSIVGSPSLAYLLDTYTCRVLALDPDTGAVFTQFGGRRGIGVGKIELDGTPRSIGAVANSKYFLTDNAGNFVCQYSLFGDFEAEYSISGWAAALALSFDQVTGWTYESGRGLYWALAQGASGCWAFAVNTAGVATGEVIDLTVRLSSTLSISVPGHSNSPAERVRTRGLTYNNGYLFLWSQGYLIRVDLANTDGDRLLVSQVNDLSPGNVLASGEELVYVLRDQPNGTAVVYVADEAGTALRSYGVTFSPADGEDGHVALPWDGTVTPTEESGARISRGLSLRARITAVAAATLSLRAAILKGIAVTGQMRARILNLGPFGQQVPMTMRARVEEPSTFPDNLVESWELSHSLGQFSQSLSLTGRGRAGFQVGDTLTLYAGYGTDRVKIFHGEIDDISRDLTADVETWNFSLRDVGAREAQTRQITYVPEIQFPRTSLDISQVIGSQITYGGTSVSSAAVVEAIAGQIGLLVNGGIPGYPLFGHVEYRNVTLLDAASRAVEPFNLFSSRQYYPILRDGAFEMEYVDWTAPPLNGYPVSRGRIKRLVRRQTRYLQSPNLVDLFLQVKGATVSFTILDEIGPQTRIEWLRTVKQADAQTPSAENTGVTPFTQDYVTIEHVSVEETWGDKVLSHVSETYSDQGGPMRLVSREQETTLYTEPTNSAGFLEIQQTSLGPSAVALPLQINSIVSGIDESDGLFKELNRSQTEYLYDARFSLAAETTTVTAFNTSTQHWELDSVQFRPHSQTTAGGVRTRRFVFTPSGDGLTIGSLDRQQVGGTRPDFAALNAQYTTVTTQITVPPAQIEFTSNGQPVVKNIPVQGQGVWSYENGAMGEGTCAQVHALAAAEQGIQASGAYRWDEVRVDALFDPNLISGQPVSIEVVVGEFVDYWIESVSHSFNTDQALTSFSAKRLTQEELP